MSEPTANPGSPLDHAALLAVLDQFAALDRYNRQRDEILDQLADAHYTCEIDFDSSERTYGYTPDDRFRDGRTVIGRLSGSEHMVSIQMPADKSKQIESMRSGDSFEQLSLFVKWSSIYDRFELQAVPSAAVPADPIVPTAAPSSDPDPPRVSEPVSEEPASEEPVSEEPASEEPATGESSSGEPLVEDRPTVAVESSVETSLPATAPAALPLVKPGKPAAATRRLPVESRDALLDADGPLTSAEIIQFLTNGLRLRKAQVTAVVDGFWDYILQLDHYDRGLRKWVLPNFGTFSLAYLGNQPALVFRSRTARELRTQQSSRRNPVASDRWIQFYRASADASDRSQWSMKRRISVWIAEQTNESLETVHRVVWELMSLVCDLMADGRRVIRWAMRGEMYPLEGQQGDEVESKSCYGFRTYGRLANKLAERMSESITRQERKSTRRQRESKEPARLRDAASFFQGPGVLRGSGAEARGAGKLSAWFSLRLWGIPWIFVILLNFAPWPDLAHSDLSLRNTILRTTVLFPLCLTVLFFIMGSVFLHLLGKSTELLFQRTLRFFVVNSVLIGLFGLAVALLQWLLEWTRDLTI